MTIAAKKCKVIECQELHKSPSGYCVKHANLQDKGKISRAQGTVIWDHTSRSYYSHYRGIKFND